MSTLEKFGILVILILVVIIGVVAVWGVGGEKDNPFAQDPSGENAVAVDPSAPPPPADVPGWTGGSPAPVAGGGPAGPVPAPGIGSLPTPANGGAPGAAPPAPAPVDAGVTTYTVQKGDTGASIARKTLGNPNRWKEIAAINGNKDPRKLKINEVLKIPAPGGTSVADSGLKPSVVPSNSFAPAVPAPAPVNPADGPTDTIKAVPVPAPEAPAREVEVRSGDTLYEIARRELGDPNLYYKILKANPGLDPKKIRPGMKVKLPAL